MPKRKVLSGSRKRVNEVQYHAMIKKEKARKERAEQRAHLEVKKPKTTKNLKIKKTKKN